MLTVAMLSLALWPAQADAWDADLRRLRLDSLTGLVYMSTPDGFVSASLQSQFQDETRLLLPTDDSLAVVALEGTRITLEGPLQVTVRPLFEMDVADRDLLLARLQIRYATLFAASDAGESVQFERYEGQSGLRSQNFDPSITGMDEFTTSIRALETLALEEANQAIEPPDRAMYHNLQVLFRRGEFQACIEAIEILGERYTERPELMAVRAGALMNLQRFDDAVTAYEQLGANPDLAMAPLAQFYRAMIEVERGDDVLAHELFAGWHREFPESDLRFTVAYYYGQTLRRLGDKRASAQQFMTASRNPTDLGMAGAARLERERLFYQRG